MQKNQQVESLQAELLKLQKQNSSDMINSRSYQQPGGGCSTQPTSKHQSQKRGQISNYTNSAIQYRATIDHLDDNAPDATYSKG